VFRKVLIANRGEIALRIVRACKELGVTSVAVYSTVDADAPFVRLADAAVHIGPAAAKLSYLYVPNLIQAALNHDVDAIHPGYGFLSEDPYFAEVCAENGITFIGPRVHTMASVGDKARVRGVMQRAGLAVPAGSPDTVSTLADAERLAAEIGYPLVIKATAGGGGRGISVAHDRSQLRRAYADTRAAARQLFGNGDVYLERFITRARHIEVQIVRDIAGTAVHLGERDCSVQRRNQKLIEEAPSPHLTAPLRQRLGEMAVNAAEVLDYLGVGTVEFLLHPDGEVTFMEVNGRIQVEHPVTEMVTGIDLIQLQIRIAAGEPLTLQQADIELRGAAIECRINAEDPAANFRPTPGPLHVFTPPGGPWTRVDAGYVAGDRVAAQYDSLLAKLIVWAPTRAEALRRMDRALSEFEVAGPGVRTTIGFLRGVVDHPTFREGQHTTGFVDDLLARPEDAAGDDEPDKRDAPLAGVV
jgi:acetyl-CoA carboxylase biotin carboxylase subunit